MRYIHIHTYESASRTLHRVYSDMHTCTPIHTRTHTCIHTYTYIPMKVLRLLFTAFTPICIRVPRSIHAHIHTCIHTYTYIHIHTYESASLTLHRVYSDILDTQNQTRPCVYVCMYICIYVYIYIYSHSGNY